MIKPTQVNIFGDKFWLVDGKHHRVDGPAIEWADGSKYWYLNNQRHREDGPAIDQRNKKEWWLYGEKLEISSQEEFEQYMKLKAFW